MARKEAEGPADKAHTLCDADITSERAVTRRSLLGALSVGAGLAAAVALGTAESAPAADSDKTKGAKKKQKKAPQKEEVDSD